MSPLLEISGLRAAFPGRDGWAEAVRGVDLALERGQVLGIVGESGSGKSVAMMALLQLLPPKARLEGSARFKGREMIGMPASEIRRIRGKEIGVIFQDPLTAFNPAPTLGDRIAEAITLHDARAGRRAAPEEAEHLLDLVAIPQPRRRLSQYPYEFPGGMRQRAMIAMAIANRPDLLIADEPTTALVVTVQAQILELLQRLREDLGLALALIAHDLGAVAGAADEIAVMYGGRIVERGSADDIFHGTRRPCTRGLPALPKLNPAAELTPIEGAPPTIRARPEGCAFHPRCPLATEPCVAEDPALRPAGPASRPAAMPGRRGRARPHDPAPPLRPRFAGFSRPSASPGFAGLASRLGGAPCGRACAGGGRGRAGGPAVTGPVLHQVQDVSKDFHVRRESLLGARARLRAVNGVSFDVAPGETFGLVGESGCGKSTLGRCITRLLEPTSGRVLLGGRDVAHASAREMAELRRDLQIVFQDPLASLHPRMTVRRILLEGMRLARLPRAEAEARVRELLALVQLPQDMAERYPHELSGGQRQRVGIARALSVDPKVVVLDEPVSALDVSVQAGVLNLLKRLQQRLGAAYVFIAHDLGVVRYVSHRIGVMYLGRIVETGPADALFRNAQHPYTQALLSAVPLADPREERRRKRIVLEGDLPSPIDPPSGCPFRTRCWKARALCAQETPTLRPLGPGQEAGCHLPAAESAEAEPA